MQKELASSSKEQFPRRYYPNYHLPEGCPREKQDPSSPGTHALSQGGNVGLLRWNQGLFDSWQAADHKTWVGHQVQRAADLGVGAREVGSHRQAGLRCQGGMGQVGCSKFGNNVSSCWLRKTPWSLLQTIRPHPGPMLPTQLNFCSWCPKTALCQWEPTLSWIPSVTLGSHAAGLVARE